VRCWIGPGKVAVLEQIARTGSISATGRVLRMSYRRTWELVEDLNRNLGTSVWQPRRAAAAAAARSHARGKGHCTTLPRHSDGYGARRT
jgi:molybdenum-dependent DNA-binding transcriptional regulator ModE